MPRRGEVTSWHREPEQEVCPICDRPIPPDQRDEHHLVPRLKGGRVVQALHRICHRQIHALFSEAELARHYATPEALRTHPEMARFIAWVQKKPDGFLDGARRSTRLRRGDRE